MELMSLSSNQGLMNCLKEYLGLFDGGIIIEIIRVFDIRVETLYILHAPQKKN